jgi:hypothetical protein
LHRHLISIYSRFFFSIAFLSEHFQQSCRLSFFLGLFLPRRYLFGLFLGPVAVDWSVTAARPATFALRVGRRPPIDARAGIPSTFHHRRRSSHDPHSTLNTSTTTHHHHHHHYHHDVLFDDLARETQRGEEKEGKGGTEKTHALEARKSRRVAAPLRGCSSSHGFGLIVLHPLLFGFSRCLVLLESSFFLCWIFGGVAWMDSLGSGSLVGSSFEGVMEFEEDGRELGFMSGSFGRVLGTSCVVGSGDFGMIFLLVCSE